MMPSEKSKIGIQQNGGDIAYNSRIIKFIAVYCPKKGVEATLIFKRLSLLQQFWHVQNVPKVIV